MTNVNERYFRSLLDEFRSTTGENEWVEFKVDNDDPQLMGEYIAALSNSACLHDQPYGYLIYGVHDQSREIVGTHFKPRDVKIGNQELENWLATQLNPRVDFRIFELECAEKPVVVIRIDATYDKPVRFKGIEYIRIGSYKQKLIDFPEKAKKIWLKSSKQEFEVQIAKERVDEDEVLKLLDYPNYFSLLNQNLPTNKESILNKLAEERLIVKNGSLYDITNLGAVLFAKDVHQFDRLSRKAVRVIMYKGKNKLQTIKEHVVRNGYAVGFEYLINYINDQLPSNEEIGKVFRKEVKMYPELAIRELVANAIIHQDFTEVGSGPMVEIFEDRIEISNPGKPLISSLRFIDHNPQSRNEKLAYFMRRINLCEERGSGIDKVVNLAEVYQLPAPNFIEGDNYIKVIMYAYKSLKEMDKTDKVRACYQHCCLKYVSSEFMTNQTFRERLQIEAQNYSSISRIIAECIEANLIKPYDPDTKSKRFAKYVPFWA